MLRNLSLAWNRPEPTSPSKSSPSSPTSRKRLFYQHPSGSRFTEEAVSAILSSEAGSDASVMSLGVPSAHSIPPWNGMRTQPQPCRPQKLRRAPRPFVPLHVDALVGDASSDVSSTTWTTASISTMTVPPAPESLRSISFCPVPHPAESFTEYDRLQVRSGENPALVLLRAVAPERTQLCAELLHTSLPLDRDIIPRTNGFVGTVLEAYNNHRGLIVRPDDVWLAIMTQFSFFINGHAEALRKVFSVAHDGRRESVVESGGDRYAMDTATVVHRVTALMEEHIPDPSLRDWILPDFTTTTAVDKTTCAIVMMGTNEDEVDYKCSSLRCGIPKVTLEGEQKDWQTILDRLEHLKQYGIQTIAWYHLLRPVITRVVAAYDDPTHPHNLDFWNKVAHVEVGNGPEWVSGWITAFCVFNAHGRWQGNALNQERSREHAPKKLLRPADPLQLTPSHFAAVYTVRARAPPPYLVLDGFPYPTVERRDVPSGYVCLDVGLEGDGGECVETTWIAGSVGSKICSTEKTELFRNGLRDTVKPVSAWWYFVKQPLVNDEAYGDDYGSERAWR